MMHALKFRSAVFLFRAMKGLKKKYIKILLVVFLEKFLCEEVAIWKTQERLKWLFFYFCSMKGIKR